MNFCQSNITSVPQATATHSLRETTLDACALGVELGVFLSLFTLASLLQRQKLRKASAKAREFEKWCGQNEGDNSAPRMLKNRPAIVPLKTEV